MYESLVGKKFGLLTVIEQVSIPPTYSDKPRPLERWWRCQCDCGGTNLLPTSVLRANRIKSCGCLKSKVQISHGLTVNNVQSKEYSAWSSAKKRCNDKNNISYVNYGARGIRMCDKWLDNFEAFLADVGTAPGPEFTLDRINNNGDYEPGNVRWATRVEQRHNRRDCKGGDLTEQTV